jgi:hypothetical protein
MRAVDAVPARFDADHAGREVDVLPPERLAGFPEPQSRVERGPVERTVAQRERREQPARVVETRDADAIARGEPLAR